MSLPSGQLPAKNISSREVVATVTKARKSPKLPRLPSNDAKFINFRLEGRVRRALRIGLINNAITILLCCCYAGELFVWQGQPTQKMETLERHIWITKAINNALFLSSAWGYISIAPITIMIRLLIQDEESNSIKVRLAAHYSDFSS